VPAAGNYQFATASFNTAKTAQQTIQSLTTQRQNLQAQRDSALQSLQSATTQSDVQKWTAVLQTLNSSISHIDAQIQQVGQQVSLQQAQISAGQAVYQATQREQVGAAMLNGMERDLGSFSRVTSNYLQPVQWNSMSGGGATPNSATMNIPSGAGVVIQ
jgi:chromosome segregation ATPase